VSKKKRRDLEHRRRLSGDGDRREQVIRAILRADKFDRITEEVLRELIAISSIRSRPVDKLIVQLPDKITQEQAMKLAKPLRRFTPEGRQRVIDELKRVPSVGLRMAELVRLAVTNPLDFLAGKSPIEAYLALCERSGMHPAIVRALHHLRDAISVTTTKCPPDGSINYSWTLVLERITREMFERVQACLGEVDIDALHTPQCDRWLAGIQFFDQVKTGRVQIIPRIALPPASLPGATDGPILVAAGAEEIAAVAQPPLPAEASKFPKELQALVERCGAYRARTNYEYLELSGDDFAALCRSDQVAWDCAQHLGEALERTCVDMFERMRAGFSNQWAVRAPEGDAWREEDAAEVTRCLQSLTTLATSCRYWEQGMPQQPDSLARRLLFLLESSLVSGLFFVFLQRRFPELFRDIEDEELVDSHRIAALRARADRQMQTLFGLESQLDALRRELPGIIEKGIAPTLALEVTDCCYAAFAAFVPLFLAANSHKWRDLKESPCSIEKPMQRFLIGRIMDCDESAAGRGYVALTAYEPGALPPLRCRFVPEAEQPTKYGQAEICRFSLRGGVALSPSVALPIAKLLDGHGRVASLARYIGVLANDDVAQWPDVASCTAVRQCMRYLNDEAVRILQIESFTPDSVVSLLGLPGVAMEMTDEFEQSMALRESIVDSPEFRPLDEVLAEMEVLGGADERFPLREYSLCVLNFDVPEALSGEEQDAGIIARRKKVKGFLKQKSVWPLEEAEAILKTLGIAIESKEEGAPHGRIRFQERNVTLPSRVLKDKQVFANSLYRWICTLRQDEALAALLEHNDPRLGPWIQKHSRAND
jgi:hypothetical protein